ncbi:MAG: quaternary ammonium transporter [Actinomycetota bacterium]|nr:quaternary ammonium transporter [Actinomycetota bacterium]
MKHNLRHLLTLVCLLAAGVLLAACGGSSEGGGGSAAQQPEGGGQPQGPQPIRPVSNPPRETITVGSKNFEEQYILAEIYSQALEAAGYTIETESDIGSEVVAFKALKQSEIDAYPEYTGTALVNLLDVPFEDVPRAPPEAFQLTKAQYAEEGIVALPPTPFENSYRLGVTKETAQKLGNPTKISDLKAKAGELAITGYPECRQRSDCLRGVERAYGLEFGEFVSSETPYEILDNGEADVAFVFTTDGNLNSGQYQVLDDDKNFFPPYNVTLSMREEAFNQLGQQGVAVIESVQKPLTDEVMQELNSRVVIDKQEPEQVAEDYLQQFGFVQG